MSEVLLSSDVVLPSEVAAPEEAAPEASTPASPAPERSLERVPEPLRAALERRGFTELTAVQQAALDHCGESRDLQISSQTGSGKTVALGLVTAPTLLAERDVHEETEEGAPARPLGPQVLVIVPTRELASQVRTELDSLYSGVPTVQSDCVTGGTSPWQERTRLKKRAPRVLVGTPGRLLDHLKSGALDLGRVRHLVLDEADQMLDMGFREELEAILDQTPTERRTHLVSATFPRAILQLAERYQRDPVQVEGTALGEVNADIEHIACCVRDHERYDALVNLLLLGGEERTLMFVNTRAETSEVAERLSQDGFAALPLSGELVQAQRTRTLAAFKSGAVSVLVATDVASRGLDVPDVATVIHSSPALDSEVYIHRSGRTGRAGNKGTSISLVQPRKERRVKRLLHEAGVEVDWRPAPTADDVKRVLAKRARRATWEALENAPEPSEERLAEAQKLLAERSPEEVVAVLLDMARPANGPAAREIGAAPAPHVEPRREMRPGDERRGRHTLTPTPRPQEGTRFHINWGGSDGATPRRVLAHICRRSGLQGNQVGAIRIQDHFSTFDVLDDVERFEQRVSHRDKRDPHVRIRRFEERARPRYRSAAH